MQRANPEADHHDAKAVETVDHEHHQGKYQEHLGDHDPGKHLSHDLLGVSELLGDKQGPKLAEIDHHRNHTEDKDGHRRPMGVGGQVAEEFAQEEFWAIFGWSCPSTVNVGRLSHEQQDGGNTRENEPGRGEVDEFFAAE